MTIASNVVTAAFEGEMRSITVGPRYQYDYGQILMFTGIDLPQAYQVYFSNGEIDIATTRIGTDAGVEIPNEYFESGDPVFAWLFLHDGEADGRTVYRVMIPVIQRAYPEHEEPTPEQESEINQAIATLNRAIEQTGASEKEAGDYALLSKSYAVGRTGFREGEDLDNAKFYSEVAEQAAAESGWVQFYIDENGYLHYVKTPNTALEFYISNGCLYVRL